jgi:ribosomal protein L34E
LARTWPGGRARERQIKRQGGASRCCPMCGVTPRTLPRNRDGSLSRSRTTDAIKELAGVMTSAQQAEHTALRRGAVTGKLPRPAERGAAVADLWAGQPAASPPKAGAA